MNQEVWSDWIDHDGQGVPNIGLCWIEVYAKTATRPGSYQIRIGRAPSALKPGMQHFSARFVRTAAALG